MRISMFGTVGVASVADTGPVVELPHRPGIVLMALAARHGQTVRDDLLIDAIWPSERPSSAKQALQGYIVAVRNALEPDRPFGDPGTFVVRDATGYRLLVEPHQLDLAEFDAHSESLRTGTDERTLERLIELSDRPVAADVVEGDWIAAVRAGVAERRLAALTERFELELDVESGATQLGRMRAATDEFPFDERMVGSLMTALYRCGRQAEALAAYDNVRRRLRDELGVTPGERLAAIHLDVLEQAPSLDLARKAAGIEDRPVVDDRDGVIGRSDDIAAVADVLLTRRTVTVVGPGGAGKTTVIRGVLRELVEKFPSPIVLDASTVGAGTLFDEIVRRVGVDRHPLLDTDLALHAALVDRAHLFVIDTCDARLTEAREAAEQLRGHGSVSVLLASREPVRHSGELVHRVAGLTESDAFALLQLLVGAGVDTDEESLGQLVRRVDCLPLALEMIAPRVASLGAAEVLREVGGSGQFIEVRSSTQIPDRHRSIDALVSWSLDRLDEHSLRLLIRCAALHGPFPIDALDEFSGAAEVPVDMVASTLAVLVDASLISREGDAPATFTVFDTVRDVVRRTAPDEFAAEQGAVDSHVVAAAWGDYTGATVVPLPNWVAERFGATLERLLVIPDSRSVMLATAAARRWLDLGSLAQGSAALHRALTSAPDVPPPLVSLGWTILGFNQVYQGDVQAALGSYRRAAIQAESVSMDGYVELVTSTVAWLECDFERAWTIASSAVEMVTTESRRAPANLVAFGKIAMYVGDLDGASDCYARALRLSRVVGDAVAEANALRLTAVLRALHGDHDRALADALRAAALHDAAESTLGAAQSASTVALVAALADDNATASTWAQRAITHARRQFDVQTVCVVIPVIASIDVSNQYFERPARLIGWIDHYLAQQEHPRHPTARALFDQVDAALSSLNSSERRVWNAEGAAMSAAQMLDLAAE